MNYCENLSILYNNEFIHIPFHTLSIYLYLSIKKKQYSEVPHFINISPLWYVQVEYASSIESQLELKEEMLVAVQNNLQVLRLLLHILLSYVQPDWHVCV